MEPVTHILTGAILARTGLNRRAAYTTAAMAVAAEFPDCDTLWGLRGPIEGFAHHRGITHTFLALPIEAAVLLAGFWAMDRWRVRRYGTSPGGAGSKAAVRGRAPVRWGLLYGFLLLALLSHIALDWTNNYGVRPFFPFNARWYAGSILFIFDPLVFLFLLSALVLPGLFRLVGREVGAAPVRFVPRRWAAGALVCVVGLLGLRGWEHAGAVTLAMAQSSDATPSEPSAPSILSAERALVSPDPFSPFQWHAAVDFGPYLQQMDIDARHGLVALADEHLDKPPRSAALEQALRSPLGRAYMDWSPMPALSVSEDSGEQMPAGAGGSTVVIFRDPRFMADVPLLNRGGVPPLTGTVELDRQGRVVDQTMDGREEPIR